MFVLSFELVSSAFLMIYIIESFGFVIFLFAFSIIYVGTFGFRRLFRNITGTFGFHRSFCNINNQI